MIAAPDPSKKFSVQKAELVVFNRDVRELVTDFEMLVDIVKVQTHNTILDDAILSWKMELYERRWTISFSFTGTRRRRAARLPGTLYCQ